MRHRGIRHAAADLARHGSVSRRLALIVCSLVLAAACNPTARAGIFVDQLNQCIDTALKPADQPVLVQWLFAVVSLNPAIKSESTVTPAQRETAVKNMEALYSRLVSVNCRKEALTALKYEEAPNVLPMSFQELESRATQGLINEPAVRKGASVVSKYMSSDDQISKLIADAQTMTPDLTK
jgi:hypothetical protein